jgi:hypothetical protein
MTKATGLKYQELYDCVVDRGIEMRHLAQRLGIERTVLYRKFKGQRKFREIEIETINIVLGLSKKEAKMLWNFTNVLGN